MRSPVKKPVLKKQNAATSIIAAVKRANGVPGVKNGGNWIQGAIQKPGALRKALGVKAGDKIPAKALNEAAKKPGATGKRARLAQTLKSFHK